MVVSIGLIGEGITDHILIKYIISGLFKGEEPLITELQPRINPNDESRTIDSGNWDQVFKYCASQDFRDAFVSNPSLHVIIQMDSDVFRSGEVSEKYRFSFNKDGTALTTDEIIEELKKLIILEIGQDFYDKVKSRIIFAIAVDAIECWLLPFYCTGNNRSKEVNCLNTLNNVIRSNSKIGFTIHKKEVSYYHKLAKPLSKFKELKKSYSFNRSLEVFCNTIDSVFAFRTLLIFQTKRLIIRKLVQEDGVFFKELFSAPEIIDPIPDIKYSESEIKGFFNSFKNPDENILNNKNNVWGITEKNNSDIIGLCLFVTNDENDRELGYRFRKKYWGKGYGTEVAKGTIDFAFNDLKLDKITAYAQISNSASIKILEKFLKPVEEFYCEKHQCNNRRYAITHKSYKQS